MAYKKQVIDSTVWQSNHAIWYMDTMTNLIVKVTLHIITSSCFLWNYNTWKHTGVTVMTSTNGNIFLRYWLFVQGIHWSPVNTPHKGQWRRTLMFSLICVWINTFVNNCEVGDLKCHHTHNDIIVMQQWASTLFSSTTTLTFPLLLARTICRTQV